jgi:hypothetical protein
MGAIRNLLRTGSNKLDEFFEKNMSELVVYRPRGESRTATIRVTPGGSRGGAEENQSVRTEIESQDFIVRTETPVECQSDTFLNWLGREPEQNDEIIFDGQRYLVTPAFRDELFRYTDAFHTAIRIHTAAAGPAQ